MTRGIDVVCSPWTKGNQGMRAVHVPMTSATELPGIDRSHSSYCISSLTNQDICSKKYQPCTGIYAIGESVDDHNSSLLGIGSHQVTNSLFDIDLRDYMVTTESEVHSSVCPSFLQAVKTTLRKLCDQTKADTRAVMICGGQFDHDDLARFRNDRLKYCALVTRLSDVVREVLNIETMCVAPTDQTKDVLLKTQERIMQIETSNPYGKTLEELDSMIFPAQEVYGYTARMRCYSAMISPKSLAWDPTEC